MSPLELRDTAVERGSDQQHHRSGVSQAGVWHGSSPGLSFLFHYNPILLSRYFCFSLDSANERKYNAHLNLIYFVSISSSTHFPADILCSLLWLDNTPIVSIFHVFFIHSCSDGSVGCFHVVVVRSSAVMVMQG